MKRMAMNSQISTPTSFAVVASSTATPQIPPPHHRSRSIPDDMNLSAVSTALYPPIPAVPHCTASSSYDSPSTHSKRNRDGPCEYQQPIVAAALGASSTLPLYNHDVNNTLPPSSPLIPPTSTEEASDLSHDAGGTKKQRSQHYQPPRTVPRSVVSVMGSLVGGSSGGPSTTSVGMRRQLSGSQLDQFLGEHDKVMPMIHDDDNDDDENDGGMEIARRMSF